MKKHLLKTSALVGSLFVLGTSVSYAQTTVTGNLDISYRAVKDGANAQDSFRGFGKEAQINIQNKGKLNNGWEYAAGFSLEFDGNDHGQQAYTQGTANTTTGAGSLTSGKINGDLSGALSGENTYIDLIIGNTTLSFGADHIQNPDSHAHINPAGVGYITSYTTKAGLYPTAANSVYGSYGFGIIQNVPNIGKLSFNYVPNPKFGTSTISGTVGPDIGNAATIAHYDGAEESAYEVGFNGDFGVKGLNVLAYKTMESGKEDGKTSRQAGYRIGASYNFGDITVGVDKTQTTNASQTEVNGKAASLTYAVTKDLSIGATYGKASSTDNVAAPEDEKIKLISVGYNLGPVAVNATARKVENNGGVDANDNKDVIVKLSTKF